MAVSLRSWLFRAGAGLAVIASTAGLVTVAPAPAGAAVTTPVMASSAVSAADLAGWFRSTAKVSRATVAIDELAGLYVTEGAAEGVAGDLAFAQSIVETGYFNFSTRVPASFNNFSGLGAVDGGTGAAQFATARVGVRAQVQHLRAYADPTASVATLANPLVDPRFHLVLPKGRAPTWEQFGNGTWATDPTYAAKVLGIHRQILAWAGVNQTWAPFGNVDQLVVQAHQDLIARDPSWGELAAGADALDRGTHTPATYLAALVDGEGAAHGQPVARLYLAGLGRAPDRGGLQYWTRRHASGVRLTALAEGFLTSSEFARRYGRPSDAGYVALLYRNVLGRAGDPSGTDYWARRIAGGRVDRAQLLVQFSQSSEHVAASRPTVEASIVYLGMLGRPADPSGLSWWTTRRTAGAEVSVLTGQVFGSSEYRSRIAG